MKFFTVTEYHRSPNYIEIDQNDEPVGQYMKTEVEHMASTGQLKASILKPFLNHVGNLYKILPYQLVKHLVVIMDLYIAEDLLLPIFAQWPFAVDHDLEFFTNIAMKSVKMYHVLVKSGLPQYNWKFDRLNREIKRLIECNKRKPFCMCSECGAEDHSDGNCPLIYPFPITTRDWKYIHSKPNSRNRT